MLPHTNPVWPKRRAHRQQMGRNLRFLIVSLAVQQKILEQVICQSSRGLRVCYKAVVTLKV